VEKAILPLLEFEIARDSGIVAMHTIPGIPARVCRAFEEILTHK
jgi:hypothetical protein